MPDVNQAVGVSESVSLSIASSNPITLSHTFINGEYTNLGTKIMANFNDVATLVNGNVQGENLSGTASLHIAYMTMSTKIVTPEIRALGDSNITADLTDFTGTRIKVVNSDGDVLFELDASGTVWIGAAKIEPNDSVGVTEDITVSIA